MMTDAQKAQIFKLYGMNNSYAEIAEEMGMKKETVKAFIRRHRNDAPVVRCENCGKIIYQVPKQKPKRFCSDKCRSSWWNNHREEQRKMALYTFNCNYCGKKFTVYGKKNAKYCSVECCCKARTKAYETKRQRLKSEAISCRAVLQDLPSGCLCSSCQWFVDGKRSCPCQEKAQKKV